MQFDIPFRGAKIRLMIDFIDTTMLAHLSWNYLLILLFHPESLREFFVSVTIGFIAVMVGLSQFHALGNSSGGSLIIGFIVGAVGVFAMIEIAALSQMYVLPLVTTKSYHPMILTGCLVAAFMLMIVPFTRAFYHAGYGTSLMAWIIATLSAAILIFGSHTVVKPVKNEQPPTIQSLQHYGEEVKKGINE